MFLLLMGGICESQARARTHSVVQKCGHWLCPLACSTSLASYVTAAAVIRPLLACKLPDERALLEDFILAAASDTGTGSAAVPSPSISWSSIAGTHGRPDRYACLTVLERVLLVLASWGAAVTAGTRVVVCSCVK
jgi:hypothetical protein